AIARHHYAGLNSAKRNRDVPNPSDAARDVSVQRGRLPITRVGRTFLSEHFAQSALPRRRAFLRNPVIVIPNASANGGDAVSQRRPLRTILETCRRIDTRSKAPLSPAFPRASSGWQIRMKYVPDTYILGIESSCDETAAAVVRSGEETLSNV